MKYVKQLDAIRALAVILVIASHWIPTVNVWKVGEIGVDIFFVLSGFLITGILLEGKGEVEAVHGSRLRLIKNFIIRRALRIFPIYYLVIFIHLILDDRAGNTIRESFVFHLTYTSNFFFVLNPRFDSLFTHLWSLSVEEQFYLIWPWVILLINTRRLNSTLWLCFIAAALFSFLVPGRIDKLMPACMGSFALGAWVAFRWVLKIPISGIQMRILNAFSILSFMVLVLYPLIPKGLNPYSLIRIFTSILTMRIIVYCLYENNIGLVNLILRNGFLIFIGKISYGIYLIHTLGPWLWQTILTGFQNINFDFYALFPILSQEGHFVNLVMQFGLVVGLSWISWVCFESPIIRLKKYFEYTPTQQKTI